MFFPLLKRLVNGEPLLPADPLVPALLQGNLQGRHALDLLHNLLSSRLNGSCQLIGLTTRGSSRHQLHIIEQHQCLIASQLRIRHHDETPGILADVLQPQMNSIEGCQDLSRALLLQWRGTRGCSEAMEVEFDMACQ